jgi:hypothetical protein
MVPSRPNRFHAGFLGGKARRIPLHAIRLRFAVLNLALGVDPSQKTLAVPLDRLVNPPNLGNVDADPDNHARNVSTPSVSITDKN